MSLLYIVTESHPSGIGVESTHILFGGGEIEGKGLPERNRHLMSLLYIDTQSHPSGISVESTLILFVGEIEGKGLPEWVVLPLHSRQEGETLIV